jgi:hypothetical protein
VGVINGPSGRNSQREEELTDQESCEAAAHKCLCRFLEAAFRFHEAKKIVLDSPLLLKLLAKIKPKTTHGDKVTLSLFECRFERWVFALGEILVPLDPIPEQIKLTGKNTIRESEYPEELLGLKTALELLA